MTEEKERWFYSAKVRGFYPYSDKEVYEKSINGWPDDAVEITAEYRDELFEKQSAGGYEIQSNEKGYPVAVEWAEESDEDKAKYKREELLKEADEIIQPMMGYAYAGILNDSEKKYFKSMNEYRKSIDNIDPSSPDITWPEKPAKE